MLEWLDPKFLIQTFGLIGVIVIIFAESGLFFGFFLPGDSLLFTAGFLASQGYMNIALLAVGSFIAAVAGDTVGYLFGRKVGPSLFSKEDSFFFKRKNAERAAEFYREKGSQAIILARFMPVVRTFAPIVAGVANMHYGTFIRYNLIGGALWTFSMTGLGYFLGNAIPDVDKYLLPIILAIVAISFVPPIMHIMKGRKH
jgi:membrane-associated protein